MEKLDGILTKYVDLKSNPKFIVDLVDTTGERKYLTSKRDAQASEYLVERGTYHLCQILMMGADEGKHLEKMSEFDPIR